MAVSIQGVRAIPDTIITIPARMLNIITVWTA